VRVILLDVLNNLFHLVVPLVAFYLRRDVQEDSARERLHDIVGRVADDSANRGKAGEEQRIIDGNGGMNVLGRSGLEMSPIGVPEPRGSFGVRANPLVPCATDAEVALRTDENGFATITDYIRACDAKDEFYTCRRRLTLSISCGAKRRQLHAVVRQHCDFWIVQGLNT